MEGRSLWSKIIFVCDEATHSFVNTCLSTKLLHKAVIFTLSLASDINRGKKKKRIGLEMYQW
jgi:hypothetical protein